jgi:hypothetical protein
MNKETMFDEWLRQNEKGFAHDYEVSMAYHAFIAGFDACEKQLLEQVSEGFEEWFLNYPSWRVEMSRQESCLKAWQASTLHSAKLLAEKDAEIEACEKMLVKIADWDNCNQEEINKLQELCKKHFPENI